MKVKNLMFSGFAAAMFAGVIGGADAATYNLASKDYVDTKITGVNTEIDKKQDKLTAGDGVTITESETGTTIDTKPVNIGGENVSVADAITNITNVLGEIPADSTVQGELEKKVDKTTYNEFVAGQAQKDAEQDASIALIKGDENGAGGFTELAEKVATAETDIDNLQTDIEKKEDVANKVETKTAYDALGDQDDKTKLYTSVAVAEAIAASATTDVTGRVGALETTVNDATNGLVKKVADLETADTTMGTRVGALETTVNDATNGLVKKVTDLEAADTTMGTRVGTLETDVADLKTADADMDGRVDTLETTVGTIGDAGLLVDGKAVTDIVAAVAALDEKTKDIATDGELSNLSNTVEQVSGKVTSLETAVGDANSGLVADVAGLKSADTEMDGRVDALELTVGDATKGLVKDVDALETTVGNAESGLVKDVNTLGTDVNTLKGSVQTLQDANYINTNGKDLGGYIIKANGQGGYELLDVAIVDGTGEKDLITNEDLVTVTE